MCVCQLVLTVGLLAVVVYLYTVLAFNFFRKFYNKSDDKDTQDMKCNDMLTVSSICILTHTRTVVCLHIYISTSILYLAMLIFLVPTHSATHLIFFLKLRGFEEDSHSDPYCWSENCLFVPPLLLIKMMDTWIQNSSSSLSSNTPPPALF